MKIRGVLLVAVMSFGLAACAGPGDSPSSTVEGDETNGPVDDGRDRLAAVLDIKPGLEGPNRPHAVYACPDGRRLTVVFEAEQALVTTEPGAEPLALPQQPAASGIRYATATHDLHSRGREAQWTVGRMMPVTCRALRP